MRKDTETKSAATSQSGDEVAATKRRSRSARTPGRRAFDVEAVFKLAERRIRLDIVTDLTTDIFELLRNILPIVVQIEGKNERAVAESLWRNYVGLKESRFGWDREPDPARLEALMKELAGEDG
jgi:hypothetical protein